ERPAVWKAGERVVEGGTDGGPYHRAEDRPEAADDDHRHEIDREEHVEGIGRQEPDYQREEAAGHAGVERRDDERERLVRGQVDAAGLRRDLALADGQERAARPRPADVDGG